MGLGQARGKVDNTCLQMLMTHAIQLGAKVEGNCRGMLRGTTIRKRRKKECISLKFDRYIALTCNLFEIEYC